jgi:RimJ/RimL family protein N-acetyltransferase
MTQPTTLEGAHVQLLPLSIDHHPALCAIGLDKDIWRWMPYIMETPGDMKNYIQTALANREKGTELPFTTTERATGKIVGCTRFMNIDRNHRRMEIGSTWIGKPWQRSAVNTEAKYLMIRHAFEDLGCIRVELKTDALNEQSRNAILRIGAKEEGILRRQLITPSGRVRDTVYFSILDSEWPAVKQRLEERMIRSA